MSGQTVSGNALQFTNDNKQAYAYSGVVDANNIETTLLNFNTNSEYLNAKIQIYNESGSADDFRYKIYFNNIVVISTYSNSGSTGLRDTPFYVVISPFTDVQITAENISAADIRKHTAVVAATVGMPQRVGNLVE